MVPLYHVVTRR
ncbi:hypothetical protein E2C01_102367 [Portunus trituberculatus]|uniref:Uncharacterized protein n=1 Tax=Portunus trituberculatus TaxID=210409 RepID=A0A5B7KCE4_PORTR|nr:hypothetical protein [Portunus trituberculatus]